MGGRRRFWAGQRRVEVDNTVTKNLENHPQQNNVSCPVGGRSESVIQSPRISRIIRNKTTFRGRSAAGRGRRGCLFGDVEYQLVTITPRAEPPQNSGVGATAF